MTPTLIGELLDVVDPFIAFPSLKTGSSRTAGPSHPTAKDWMGVRTGSHGRLLRGRRAQCDVLGVVPPAELRRLRPVLVPSFLHDRRDLGVGDEALPAGLVPVEQHPDPALLVGITEDGRTLRPVQSALLGSLGGKDLLEALVVLDGRRCQDHLFTSLCGCRCRVYRNCSFLSAGWRV